MTKPRTVLLVLPCFRESSRLGAFLPELCQKLETLGGCRVLVVDDGSGADEQRRMNEMVGAIKAKHPAGLCDLLMLEQNLGKGGAVYAGWGQGVDEEWLAFVDADGSVSAEEVCRLIEIARQSGPEKGAVFASRVLMLGKDVRRRLHRHLLGRVYATLASTLLNLPVYDSQCGCKLVPARAFRAIAPSLSTQGFAFDLELLVMLLDSGCPVREEPIDWQDVAGGKVRLIRDSIRMFFDVLQIRRQRRRKAQGSPR